MARSLEMQEINEDPEETIEPIEPIDAAERSLPTCARCEIPMACIVQQARPSWKQVFERDIYGAPSLNAPAHHIQVGPPAAYHIDRYG